ncbi:superinfection immunity protein [Chitinolyticbacter meiyuanensis]
MPSIIAVARRTKQRAGICVLNLLMGWSGIGWIAAFIWAFVDQKDHNAP